MPNRRLEADANAAVSRIIAATLEGDVPVGASAPPGAGKTRLVTEVADEAVQRGVRTVVIANNNDQADQLVRRVAARSPGATITFPVSSKRETPVPADIRHLAVTGGATRTALQHADVTICTADKAGFLFCDNEARRGAYALHTELLVVDEAFQLPWAKFQRTNRRFDQLLTVGDPGQLDPFSSVPLPSGWRAANTDHPLDPAPRGWEAAGYALVHDALPATFRLPPTAAPVIAQAFYPGLPFDSIAVDGDRELRLRNRGVGPASDAIELASAAGWTYRELPSARATQADPEVVEEIVSMVQALFARRPETDDEEYGRRDLTPDRVAIGVSHRDQRHAVSAALALRGIDDVAVHTANTIQGLEFDVTFVWHPLSGQTDASFFHVDAGRMCVLLSRHRHTCIVVGRGGIGSLLDSYPPPEEQLCNGEPNPELTGWEAHETVWRHLQEHAA